MKQTILQIKENTCIAKNVYKLTLAGDVQEHLPGQFVNIKVPGVYLRRPLSVCECAATGGRLVLCYKVVGEGTKILSSLDTGENLDVLTGLGNGYDLKPAFALKPDFFRAAQRKEAAQKNEAKAYAALSAARGGGVKAAFSDEEGEIPAENEKTVLLAGGGMGTAPLYFLAKKLVQNNIPVHAVLGFNAKEEIFYKEEFESLGCAVTVATADGSAGVKGFVTDALPQEYGYFYACGPVPMMKALSSAAKTSGQFSLEERMGCGFGACMGCSIKVRKAAECGDRAKNAFGGGNENEEEIRPGIDALLRPDKGLSAAAEPEIIYKRICTEGPVFRREEIIWED